MAWEGSVGHIHALEMECRIYIALNEDSRRVLDRVKPTSEPRYSLSSKPDHSRSRKARYIRVLTERKKYCPLVKRQLCLGLSSGLAIQTRCGRERVERCGASISWPNTTSTCRTVNFVKYLGALHFTLPSPSHIQRCQPYWHPCPLPLASSSSASEKANRIQDECHVLTDFSLVCCLHEGDLIIPACRQRILPVHPSMAC